MTDKKIKIPKLWNHQAECVERALQHEGFGIFFDMGAGKTLTTLEIIRESRAMLNLVLCPKRVVSVWPEEIEKHYGEGYATVVAPSVKLSGKKKAEIVEAAIAEWIDAAKSGLMYRLFIVTNHDSAWRPPMDAIIERYKWCSISVDEAHRVKNYASHLNRFLTGAKKNKKKIGRKGVQARRRLALTGTPVANNAEDTFGVFRFINPKLFGPYITPFRSRYCNYVSIPNTPVPVLDKRCPHRNMQELKGRIAEFCMSVETDAVIELPDEIENWIWGEMDSKGRKAYDTLETELYIEIKNAENEVQYDKDGLPLHTAIENALTKMLRLQQLAAGYLVDNEGTVHDVSNHKKEMFKEWMLDLPENEPLVFFSRFTAEVQAVREIARKLKRPDFELSGQADTLAEWKESAKEGSGAVISIQIQAGGLGISLVEARHYAYGSTGVNAGDYWQSRKRVRRPGQKRKHYCTHFGSRKTIDVDTRNALARKESLANYLLGRIQKGLNRFDEPPEKEPIENPWGEGDVPTFEGLL